MAYDRELADRIRTALAPRPALREVKMFGGLSFMVDGKLVVNVGSAGDLLVRVDPERADEHLRAAGVREGEMGPGRPMGRGWLVVDADAVATDEALASWIDAALEFTGRAAARKRGT